MGDTFTHKFGGWLNAEARRRRNPDGSEGGIVAVGATVDPTAIVSAGCEVFTRANIGDGANIGSRASIGPGANIGYGASIGPGAEYSAEDWLFVLGPQGKRSAWLTAVWSPAKGLRFWTGCKHGLTTDEALAAIAAAYGASHMGDDYRYAVQCVVNHPSLARAMAKAAAR